MIRVPDLQMPKGVTQRILLAASEVVGFSKTGGLADVAGSLPRGLARRGHECAIITPLYRCTRSGKIPITPTEHTFTVQIGDRSRQGRLWRATLPQTNIPVYLVEQAEYFERDDPARRQGLYQFTLPDGQKQDYSDNCERFIFFSRAVLESLRLLQYWPDVIHSNDWQTGLIPVYLRELYSKRPGYDLVRTLFTIHNIAYQGIFWHWDMKLTGLDWDLFNYQQLEFYGRLNLLKAGITFTDLITTVSPSYAREIQTHYYGCGLEGVLAERSKDLFGIVNGVDYQTWDPAIDPHLASKYDANSVAIGKPVCKAALQRRFGLPARPGVPIIGIVSRLVEQKGLSLIAQAADAILRDDTQIVVLGEGEAAYHHMLNDLQKRYPDRVSVTLGFDEPLAHQIEAGADIFLMPSQFEPSGLNQLYSLKYGTVPIVRATGGLADTITNFTAESPAAGTATGFTFVPYTPAALLEVVRNALQVYRKAGAEWAQLMRTGMLQDWSWDRSAGDYEMLYSQLADIEVSTPSIVRA